MAYLSVTEVESGLSALANTYPALTSLVTLPNNTPEGRTCHALRIGTGSAGTKDGILFLGGVHAREWGSCEICLNFATDMLEAFTGGTGLVLGGKSFTVTQVRAIVEGLHVFVFPLVNPDGRHHSQTVVPMWRRNRNPADSGGDPNCVGVDINRNYDWLWDFPNKFSLDADVAASTDPCELEPSGIPGTGTYHGSSPFSEPETKNVRWLLDTFPRIRWLVDLHSYSELILYAWGDDQNQTTDSSMNFMNPAHDTVRGVEDDDAYREFIPAADLAVETRIANRMHDAIQAVRGKNYTVQQGFALYATAGTGSDYVYSQRFVDPSRTKVHGFTIEWGTEFQPPWAEMERIVLDITAGLIEFCLAAPCEDEQRPMAVGFGEMIGKLTLPESSNRSPSIASDEARISLAWKGADNPQLNLMLSVDDGATFVGKHTSPETSPEAPSLAVCRGGTFIAWTGEGDGNLNVAQVDFTDTPSPTVTGLSRKVILPETSPHRPALASDLEGNMFLAWTGHGDGNLNIIMSSDTGATWSGKVTFEEFSSEGPAITSHQCGRLFLAWKGSGNENLNVAQVRLIGAPTSPQVAGLLNKITFAETSDHSPALVARRSPLIPALVSQRSLLTLGWTGEGEQNLNLAAPVDTASGYKKRVFDSESSDDGPALTLHRSKLMISWRGSGNEHLNIARIGGQRLFDDFTTGPDSFSVPPATITTRYQAGSMLGGMRMTALNNAYSPRGTEAHLNAGGAGRLNLMLGAEQYVRLEVIYGVREDGVHPLGINLHDGNARSIRTTISHLAGSVINFNVVILAAGGWSQAGENVGAGQIEFAFDDFTGPGGQDFTNVSYIVFIFQSSGSFTLGSIETV